ncbi:unnamed protein product [Closterium sp. Yama58-4]|nr:unnamed protein product [Closterium sp. Yama58-4]
MVLEKDLFRFYERLKESCARSGDHTLHVFVAGIYVDSAVALKILTDLLRADSLQYSVFPVYGYDDITAHANKAAAGNQAYTAVFLNCGATEDLCGLLGVGPSVSLFVVDCHRPVHLNNAALHNSKVVLAQSPESEPEDPGSFFGQPSGCVVFEMAHGMRRDTSEHLWLACVSITDQFVHSRLAPEHYTAGCLDLEDKVTTAAAMEAPRSAVMEDGVSVKLPDMGRIQFQHELRLMCLPRWNLFDSLLYSSYPATKLKTWTEPGLRRLRLLLGQLGIPHAQAKQRYPFMPAATRSRLKDDVQRFGPSHGLSDMCYRAFHRYNGYKCMNVRVWQLVPCGGGLLDTSTPHTCAALERPPDLTRPLPPHVTRGAHSQLPLSTSLLCHKGLLSTHTPTFSSLPLPHSLPCQATPTTFHVSASDVVYGITALLGSHSPADSHGALVPILALLLPPSPPPPPPPQPPFLAPSSTRFRVSASDVVYGITALLGETNVVYGITALLESHSPAPTGLAAGDNGAAAHAHTNNSFWTALSALHLRGWKQLEEGMDLAIRMQAALVRQGSLAIAKKGAIRSTCGRHRFRYMLLDDHSDARLIAHPLALTRLLLFLMDALKLFSLRLIAHPLALMRLLLFLMDALKVGRRGRGNQGDGGGGEEWVRGMPLWQGVVSPLTIPAFPSLIVSLIRPSTPPGARRAASPHGGGSITAIIPISTHRGSVTQTEARATHGQVCILHSTRFVKYVILRPSPLIK